MAFEYSEDLFSFSEEYREEIERFVQEACEWENKRETKKKPVSICKDEWYKINDTIVKCMGVIRIGDMDLFSCLTYCSISCEPILKNFVFENSGLLNSGEFEVIKNFEWIEEQSCLCWWDSREMRLISH